MKLRSVAAGLLLATMLAAPLAAQPSPSSPAVASDAQDPSHAAPRRVASGLPPQIHDLSPWRMFQDADIVVQGVMVGLALASLTTWTVFVAKAIELAMAKARLRRALENLQSASSLAEAQAMPAIRNTIAGDLLASLHAEMARTGGYSLSEPSRDRVASIFAEVVKADAIAIRRGTGLLATIGSTAPFVGLFGTVWGIMNAFIGISKAQTTNLAVVAPGIAEALLATAIGLVAAIPAVVIYNHFSRDTKAYAGLVGRASGGILRLLSRESEAFQRAEG